MATIMKIPGDLIKTRDTVKTTNDGGHFCHSGNLGWPYSQKKIIA